MDMDKYWQSYKENDDKQAKDHLIVHYVELVKIIAGRLYTDYNHHVEYDDLVSYGIIGLIDAIEKFDHNKNVKFETYANIRIRGAVIDQLRNLDWVPRSLRSRYKRFEEAMQRLQARYGNDYTDEQLANELDMSMDDMNKFLNEVSSFSVVSLEEKFEEHANFDIETDYDEFNPEQVLDKKVMYNMLKQGIEKLPEREGLIISLYYYEELTYKEIAEVLSISESRISQLHTKAIGRLKNDLKH